MNDTLLTSEEKMPIIDCIPLVEEQKKKLRELSTTSTDSQSLKSLPSIKIIPANCL